MTTLTHTVPDIVRHIFDPDRAAVAHEKALRDLRGLLQRLKDSPSEKIYLWRQIPDVVPYSVEAFAQPEAQAVQLDRSLDQA